LIAGGAIIYFLIAVYAIQGDVFGNVGKPKENESDSRQRVGINEDFVENIADSFRKSASSLASNSSVLRGSSSDSKGGSRKRCKKGTKTKGKSKGRNKR
jgi:hypothetical protein